MRGGRICGVVALADVGWSLMRGGRFREVVTDGHVATNRGF